MQLELPIGTILRGRTQEGMIARIAAKDFYSRLFGLFYHGLATLAGYFSILGGRFILYCSQNLLACFKIK
jgi:hypothetical protein